MLIFSLVMTLFFSPLTFLLSSLQARRRALQAMAVAYCSPVARLSAASVASWLNTSPGMGIFHFLIYVCLCSRLSLVLLFICFSCLQYIYIYIYIYLIPLSTAHGERRLRAAGAGGGGGEGGGGGCFPRDAAALLAKGEERESVCVCDREERWYHCVEKARRRCWSLRTYIVPLFCSRHS